MRTAEIQAVRITHNERSTRARTSSVRTKVALPLWRSFWLCDSADSKHRASSQKCSTTSRGQADVRTFEEDHVRDLADDPEQRRFLPLDDYDGREKSQSCSTMMMVQEWTDLASVWEGAERLPGNRSLEGSATRTCADQDKGMRPGPELVRLWREIRRMLSRKLIALVMLRTDLRLSGQTGVEECERQTLPDGT